MAIKIIKNTMVDPIEKECPNCGSVFSFNYSDIEALESTNIFMTKIRVRYVTCPVCKNRCSLQEYKHLDGAEIRQTILDEELTNDDNKGC